MCRAFFIGIVLLLGPILSGQAQTITDEQWAKRGEQLVLIPTNTFYQLSYHPLLSVHQITDTGIVIYVNRKQYDRLLNSGVSLIPIAQSKLKAGAVMANNLADALQWDAYPTYETYVELLTNLVSLYPDICKLDTIGFSNQNRLIAALVLAGNPANDSLPSVMLSSSMHGDELTGYVLMLRLAYYLAENYNQDAKVAELLNKVKVCINPLANPDGTYFGGNSTVFEAIRGNENYIDLNRNFPDPVKGVNPDGNLTQTENQYMIQYLRQHEFNLSVNFHGGAEVINYPWDHKATLHPDDAWFQLISRQYADSVHQQNANYMADFDDGITNGYDWYQVWGGRQDFVNHFLHGREVTAEISNVKTPSASSLPLFWDYNKASLLSYIEQAAYGLKGKILDQTGNPVKAIVELSGHDADSSQVYTNQYGYFHRFVKGGQYNMVVKAKGYISKTIPSVSISDFESKWYNIVLDLDTTSSISDKINELILYPNPASNRLSLNITGADDELVELKIFDIYGKTVRVYSETIHNGSLELDVTSFSKGLYLVKVEMHYKIATERLMIE